MPSSEHGAFAIAIIRVNDVFTAIFLLHSDQTLTQSGRTLRIQRHPQWSLVKKIRNSLFFISNFVFFFKYRLRTGSHGYLLRDETPTNNS